MKKISLFLGLAVFLFSCQPKQEEKVTIEEKKTIEIPQEKVEDRELTEEPEVNVYELTKGDKTQKMSLKWLSENTLEFNLAFDEGDKCQMKLIHKADNEYPDNDLESKDNEAGESFFVDQYRAKTDLGEIIISVEIEEGKYCWLEIADGKKDRCTFLTNVAMPMVEM